MVEGVEHIADALPDARVDLSIVSDQHDFDGVGEFVEEVERARGEGMAATRRGVHADGESVGEHRSDCKRSRCCKDDRGGHGAEAESPAARSMRRLGGHLHLRDWSATTARTSSQALSARKNATSPVSMTPREKSDKRSSMERA